MIRRIHGGSRSVILHVILVVSRSEHFVKLADIAHQARSSDGGTRLELIAIEENGELSKHLASTESAAAGVVAAMTQLYALVGFEPPWIGYFAIDDGICVGTCGFKSPPQNDRVEIAYFTFPEHESRGVATRMAKELIRIALEKLPAVTVAAQTLPEENASTSVLRKLGFRRVDIIDHPEDGMVWEWHLGDA